MPGKRGSRAEPSQQEDYAELEDEGVEEFFEDAREELSAGQEEEQDEQEQQQEEEEEDDGGGALPPRARKAARLESAGGCGHGTRRAFDLPRAPPPQLQSRSRANTDAIAGSTSAARSRRSPSLTSW